MGSAKDLGVEVDTVMVFICGERVNYAIVGPHQGF